MNLAVLLHEHAPSNPLGIPDSWPYEVQELGSGTDLPGPDWLLMTTEQYEAHILLHQTEYDEWLAGYEASLPPNTQPPGLATEAKQDVVNAHMTELKAHILSLIAQDNTHFNEGGLVNLLRLGPQNETAPTTDTASSGLNGRLQRIAQKLSSISSMSEGIYEADTLRTPGGIQSMNVPASLVSPVEYTYTPPAGETWYVERLSAYLADNTNFLYAGFGGLAALANGIQIEYKSRGVVRTLVTIQENIAFTTFFGDNPMNIYDTALVTSTRVQKGCAKFERRIVLDQTQGDYFKVRIRDNLTNLEALRMTLLRWKVSA